MLNLTPEEASGICMDQCRAMCCRGPLILRLEADEVAVFHREAVHLGTTADISPAADGGGNLLFLDHPGECCPMLDQATFACPIYEQRPRVCREFPRGRSRVAPFPVGRTISMICCRRRNIEDETREQSPSEVWAKPFRWYVQRQWRD